MEPGRYDAPVTRLFTALLLLYVALESGAPSLPGAFVFDADDSVKVVRLERVVAQLPPTVTTEPEPLAVLSARAVAEPARRALADNPAAPHTPYRARAALAPSPSDAG